MTNFTGSPGAGLRVGVLALQGGVREHAAAVEATDAAAVPVRRPADLHGLSGLVLPGGESTTMGKLLRTFGLAEPLREAISGGFPVYGSCAGMILLADRLVDPATDREGRPQETLGGLDILVRRNAFGRQRESFETALVFKGLDSLPSLPPGTVPAPVQAVFIRAPEVEKAGASVRVLARVREAQGVPVPEPSANRSADPGMVSAPEADSVARIVAVRSGNLLATSFHPEITGERRIHELFIQMIRGEA